MEKDFIGTDTINEDPIVELDRFLGENMELTKGFTSQDSLVKVVTHMLDWYKNTQESKQALCGHRGRRGDVSVIISKKAEKFQETMPGPYDSNDICTAYEQGAIDQLDELKSGAIHCKVDWYDGPLLNYTQRQQDDVLDRIGVKYNDNVLVIILKDE